MNCDCDTELKRLIMEVSDSFVQHNIRRCVDNGWPFYEMLPGVSNPIVRQKLLRYIERDGTS